VGEPDGLGVIVYKGTCGDQEVEGAEPYDVDGGGEMIDREDVTEILDVTGLGGGDNGEGRVGEGRLTDAARPDTGEGVLDGCGAKSNSE
jgi:hypothetical protein